jgi:hypothetical protein
MYSSVDEREQGAEVRQTATCNTPQRLTGSDGRIASANVVDAQRQRSADKND